MWNGYEINYSSSSDFDFGNNTQLYRKCCIEQTKLSCDLY